ncbi:MAG: MoaD/ThiS family protein [Bacteroidales bacterium]|nr:MoaD/ThiS family protein [Bacteroidales bacterium]
MLLREDNIKSTFPDGSSIEEMLKRLGIVGRAAVAINKKLVKRCLWPYTIIHPGDSILIVSVGER